LEANKKHFEDAAGIYAALRTRGVTVPTVDVLIASIASGEDCSILTRDRHFAEIGKEISSKILGI
jgi:predicted nucleic acid-binding protein